MGQHKHNPNCQLAREGKLPPKPKRMSERERKRARDRELQLMIAQAMAEHLFNQKKSEQ